LTHLYDAGSKTLTKSRGWQADFVAVPVPSIFAMVAGKLSLIVFVSGQRFQKTARSSD
jgi:hypothetical protein